MVKARETPLLPGCQGKRYARYNIVDILALMSDSFQRGYEMYSFGDTL